MKHYNFKEIKERGSCIDYAERVIGTKVTDGRCVAVWRNGERDSVAIDREKWFDHAAQEGGGLIELCARTKFGDMDGAAIQQAQEFLGDWLHLEEVQLRKSTAGHGRNRHDELIEEGYTEKARYEYRDLTGKLVYFVCRMEHPTKKKEFVQGTPDHWGLGDVTPIPYNWQAVAASDWCVIVEGEKDVETLKRDGIPATTNSGGAKKWRPEFAEVLRGKKVILLPDNDEIGKEHAGLIAKDLRGKAASIKIITVSKLPKGDVTDYYEQEGGNAQKLSELIAAAPEWDPEKMTPKQLAKEANEKCPFRNFTPEERKRNVIEKVPRDINDLIKDLHIRLQGAPYRVGEELFDRDHDTGVIQYLYDASDLFSWIARKTGKIVDWARLDGCVTKAEFFSALKSEAQVYSAISFVPDWPKREDVFYTHPAMPEPSENHRVFREFVDFFNPTDDRSKSLLTAFIMAPIFYKPMVARPLWIIDSPDGQGSGKSMIPEMVAYLYGENMLEGKPIDVSLYDLEKNEQEVIKRIISTKGRNARILRLDNVTGVLRSSALSQLVTTASISGRASYGRGEESRPNNLTYVVTVNGATVDTDIASRAYYIMVSRPKMDPTWTDRVVSYIERNRMKIFADIIDIISKHQPFGIQTVTRAPQFEERILQAACENLAQFQRVIAFLTEKKDETNTDEELARRIEEEIAQRIIDTRPAMGTPVMDPARERIFIRSQVLENWLGKEPWLNSKHPAEIIRNMARIKMLPQVDPSVTRWPHHAGQQIKRRSGIMWNYKSESETVRVIGLEKEKIAIEIIEG